MTELAFLFFLNHLQQRSENKQPVVFVNLEALKSEKAKRPKQPEFALL